MEMRSIEDQMDFKINLLKEKLQTVSENDPEYNATVSALSMALQLQEKWNNITDIMKNRIRLASAAKVKARQAAEELKTALESLDFDTAKTVLDNNNISTLDLELNDKSMEALTFFTNNNCDDIYTLNLHLKLSDKTSYKHLYYLISCSQSINILNIACCNIDDEVMIGISNCLLAASSSKLEVLVLNSNCVGDTGAISFATALKVNTHLKFVNLCMNKIGVEGAKALGEALTVNNVLENIILSGNPLLNEGVYFITEGLTYNKSVKMVGLMETGFDCVDNIVHMLSCNTYVKDLYLCDNKLSDNELNRLYEVYNLNENLICLDVNGTTDNEEILNRFVDLFKSRDCDESLGIAV